jgi:hypothetical protein
MKKIAMATFVGFAIMGFIGFFIKLIHIPINNILGMLRLVGERTYVFSALTVCVSHACALR